MARKTGITAETGKRYLFDAGVIYKNYDFTTGTGTIIGATRGGASFTIEREVREVQVDGMLGKTKGFRRITSENAMISAQMVEWTTDVFKTALPGTADEVAGSFDKITCSRDINDDDYIDNITLVVKMPEGNVARFALFNALCDEGLEIATADEDESVPSVTFSAHYDPTDDLDKRPYRIDYPTATVSYTLQYFAGVGGSIVGESSQVVVSGADGSAVVATPDSGKTFVKWSDNDSEVATRQDANVTADVFAVAIFADL